MSIINQALKKAQRERLLLETQTMSHLTRSGPSQRLGRRFLFAMGIVIALSAGAALYSWVIAPSWQSTAVPKPQAAIRHTPPDTSHRPPARTPSAQIEAHQAATQPPLAKVIASQRHTARHLPQSSSSLRPARTRHAVSSVPPEPPPHTRPQAQVLFNQAVESLEVGQDARARMLLLQAIKLDPTLKVAYNGLGNLYYQQQQYHQALTMYHKALSIDPDYAKARNNLGSTYIRLAMDTQALEELHKAIQADSSYGLAYYNLACVYARAGDSATAAQYLQRAMSIEPQARTWAQTDDDFARIRTAPEMRQLLGPS
jgi:tetratricopeptide (TPR) repeat protein